MRGQDDGQGSVPAPTTPSGPSAANNVRNASATTMVGSTNGTVTRARTALRPRKRQRYNRYAPGRPSATASAADAAACHTVNSAIRCTRGLPSTSASPGQVERRRRGAGPRPINDPTG